MHDQDLTRISKWLHENDIIYELNADLSRKTWIKNGGIAQLYIIPDNADQLEQVLVNLIKFRAKYIIVGHSSNMFFANSYDPSIILSTKKVDEFVIDENRIICDCGASLMKIAKTCIKKGIAGYEGLVGIPGTVGAAVCNNSGAYESEMSKLVERAEVLLENGEKTWLTNSDLEYSYRNSAIKSEKIKCCVLRVELSALRRMEPDKLLALAEEYTAIRKRDYEGYARNLGTVFSRMDIYAGRTVLKILLKIHRYITMPFPDAVRNRSRKLLVLAYFNKLKLYPYISEKRLNCFIWDKTKGYEDGIFYEYLEFIKSRSLDEAVLELQIIDGP